MLLIVTVFLLFLFTQKEFKDRVSLIFIWSYFILWVAQSIISVFGVYGLIVPNTRTYVYVAVHMLFFYLGFRLVRIKGKNVKELAYNSFSITGDSVKRITSSPVYIGLLLLSFAYIVSLFLQYWAAIMMSQSISDARAENALHELYGPMYYYLNMLFISPVYVITMFLFAYKTFEKRDLMWIIMGLFILINNSLGGGRSGFIDIFLYILFVGVCILQQLKKEGGVLKKYSSLLIVGVLGVLIYVLIGFVTAGREGNVEMNSAAFNESQETTNMHFVTYFVGPLVAFDQSLNNNFIAQQGGYHLGALSFNSIEEVFYMVVSRLGIGYERPIVQYAELIQDNYINIGAMNWNALYTWCNYFYFDLGFLGLIFFPFIMGVIIRAVIHYFYSHPNIYSASLLLVAYLMVAFSVIRFNFNGVASFITVCVLLYLSKRNNGRIRKIRLTK